MEKGVVIGIIVVIAVIIGGIFLIGGDDNGGSKSVVISDDGASSGGAELQVPAGEGNVDEMIVSDDGVDGDAGTGPKTVIVRMTGTGFSPTTVEINIGDSVSFTDSGASRWPASISHPTHTVYPGSSIGKCGGSQESTIFDACGLVSEYTFTFNEEGSWSYHDHFSPSKGGTIIVN